MTRLKVRIAAVLGLVFFGGLAHAQSISQQQQCVSAQDMAAIANDFNQFRELASRGQYCYDGSVESGLIASLMFLRETQFDRSMPRSPDQLFSGRFAQDWYGYFKSRIRRLQVERQCPRGVGAYVMMRSPTMYVCPAMMTDRFSALDRASIMMHEARHIDGYGHITCRTGPRAGIRGACDRRITDEGSYAVTVETYAQAAKYGSTLHPAIRAFARAAAVTYAAETFEEPATVDKKPELTLLSQNGQFSVARPLSNGGINLRSAGLAPVMGQIYMRSNLMVIFPDNRSERARAIFANNEGEIIQEPDEMIAEYNSLPANQRSSWVGFHSATQWTAKLKTNAIELKCDPTSQQSQSVNVQNDPPASTLYPTGYSRESDFAHYVARSGQIMEFGCGPQNRAFVRPSSIRYDQVFKRVYKVGGMTYGLNWNGQLFLIENGQSRALSLPALEPIADIAPSLAVSFFDGAI